MRTPLEIYGTRLESRLLLGTALYPSPDVMLKALSASAAEVITVSLRRQNPSDKSGETIWRYISESGCRLLPNTAGCRTEKEAVTLAEMSREIFSTTWIKLEVIGDDYNLQPDPFGLVGAAWRAASSREPGRAPPSGDGLVSSDSRRGDC